MPNILIANYGVGNLRSLRRGLERAGARVTIGLGPKEVEASDAIVLPGVGAFRAAMEGLDAIRGALIAQAEGGKPILGICLGMQLLLSRSHENGVWDGLDLVKGEVTRLPGFVRLPHMGWDEVIITRDSGIAEGIPSGALMYFAHSYAPELLDGSAEVAYTEYGRKFASIIERGNLFGTQFHPEKSGELGTRLLRNFVSIAKR
ncbi:MAG: imidazole glycerol phosphate synthase subunit HisH [Candidatus Bathyarchaeia archaeon]